VNKLSSVHTQIPYDYYSLKYCRPEDGIKKFAENLGEFLTGDRILNSPYDISMKKDEFCKVVSSLID
jgi:transmembrane 9 superfamily protein 2/4